MRPHKLVLKAFGPFASETVIDFDAMGDSVYLISGDTGSGKTTIFDGIVYALYGSASGEGRNSLNTEAFHSDYAKKGNHRDELSVELTFSNGGRVFTVSRRMNWGKKGDSAKAAKGSVLKENGAIIAAGSGREDKDDVTKKVTELLGLDAEQFRRIIMLAQGEFRRFLEAGSAERGEILGKLYDNRRHQDLELRLKGAAVLAKNREAELHRQSEYQLSGFVIPEDADEELAGVIRADHPDALKAAASLIGKMDEQLEKTDSELTAADGKKTALLEKKTLADSKNSQLDALEEQEKKLLGLEKQKPDREKQRNKTESALKAEKVLPLEISRDGAAKELSAAVRELGTLAEEVKKLEQKTGSLKKKAEDTKAELQPRIDELAQKLGRLSAILHFYDDLEQSEKELAEKQAAFEKAQQVRRKKEQDLNDRKARCDALSEKLQTLENAGDPAVEKAQGELDRLAERCARLQDLRASVAAVNVLAKEEDELKKKLGTARTEALEAEGIHYALNKAFVNGQSALLARDMIDKLKTEDTVVCPVCGAVHTAAGIAGFASCAEGDIPEKTQVDEALEAYKAALDKQQKAENSLKEKTAQLEEKKVVILKNASELTGCGDLGLLLTLAPIDERIKACEGDVTLAQAAKKKAESDKKEKDEAAAEKKDLDAVIAEDERVLRDLSAEETAAGTAAEAAKTSVLNWRAQLEGFPASGSEADRVIESLKAGQKDLSDQIAAAADAAQDSEKELENCKGNLAQAEQDKVRRMEAAANAQSSYAQALSEQGFEGEEVYHEAMSPEGEKLAGAQLSGWIKKQQQALKVYDGEVAEAAAMVKQLRASTEGFVRADTKVLEEELEGLDAAISALRKRHSDLSADIRTDRAIAAELERLKNEAEKYAGVRKAMAPMADTANGGFTFSRYVLGDFFRRIVEQANIHLQIMSDGEYMLVPVYDGDRRTSRGLGLRVLNTITNYERETASLSGGQSFEASLALALGLSDVVQMESSSAVQIDSMFIDEGFGSLDPGRLDKAVEVLSRLSAGKRQVGIISHVARLDECLPKKLHVIATDHGSTVRIENEE